MNTTIAIAAWSLFFFLVRAEPLLTKAGFVGLGVGMVYIHAFIRAAYEEIEQRKGGNNA